jgi:peroxiredoxin
MNFLVIVIIALAVLAPTLPAQSESATNNVTTNAPSPLVSAPRLAQRAPSFSVLDTANREITLKQFKDKALIVLFFITWEKLSLAQLPALVELQKEYGPEGFSVLGIALDEQGATTIKPFIEKNNVTFPVALMNYDIIQNFGGLTAVPTMFVIDRNHNIISKYVGITEKSVLETDLKAIFKNGSP